MSISAYADGLRKRAAEQRERGWELMREGDPSLLENSADRLDSLQAQVEVLMGALKRVMVGGNHVALLIGASHPLHTATHDEALRHYGAGDQYEAWCCWKTIMDARAALTQAQSTGSGEGEKT